MSTSVRLTIVQLIATPGTNWGGMEKHTADLSEELARRGHVVHVLAHPNYQQRFPETVKFRPLPVQLGRRNFWLKSRLKYYLHMLSPDVAHAHGNKAATLLSATTTKKAITVGTVHGTKSSHKSFHKLNGVIAVSKGIQQALSHTNVQLIHNGAKAREVGTETTVPLPDNAEFALAIGRLEPVKQFDKLITAWAALRPPALIPLYILGSGSEEKTLKEKIRTLGAGNIIKLVGYEHNPAAWLKQARVCIVSSEREGFPYALIEALLARCPVLSTPVNGAVDLLPIESLASSTDLDAMRSLLSAQLANVDGLKESQKACFAMAEKELTLATMADRTEAFYYDTISKNSDA